MFALIVIVVLVTTLWATFDAGAHEGWKSALVVLFGCLVLWIAVFPLYLVMRSKREKEVAQ